MILRNGKNTPILMSYIKQIFELIFPIILWITFHSVISDPDFTRISDKSLISLTLMKAITGFRGDAWVNVCGVIRKCVAVVPSLKRTRRHRAVGELASRAAREPHADKPEMKFPLQTNRSAWRPYCAAPGSLADTKELAIMRTLPHGYAPRAGLDGWRSGRHASSRRRSWRG